MRVKCKISPQHMSIKIWNECKNEMKQKNMWAKDKVDAPCILLSRLTFKFNMLKMQRKIL